jgi:tRNA-specific 2-thiouridylase
MVLNLEESFRRTVIEDFTGEYASARTPNPCVRCNTFVKFGTLLRSVSDMGLQKVATGHYVCKVRVDGTDGAARWVLARGRDRAKDQSYVLWGLDPSLLDRFVFPVGELLKSQVRELAREMNLPVAEKPESQDICFVGDRHYTEFLREERGGELPLSRPGPIRMGDGSLLGLHRGLIHYTVGQRRGLSVSSPGGDPLYVVALEPETNTLYVGGRSEIGVQGLVADSLNVFAADLLSSDGLSVQVRAHHDAVPVSEAEILPSGRLQVRFAGPVEGVSPGQSAVLYRDDLVVAGGRIVETQGRTKRAARAERGAQKPVRSAARGVSAARY